MFDVLICFCALNLFFVQGLQWVISEKVMAGWPSLPPTTGVDASHAGGPTDPMDEEMPTAPVDVASPPTILPPTMYGLVREVHTGCCGGQVWIEDQAIIFARWSKSGRADELRWYYQHGGSDPQNWLPVPDDWFRS